MKIRGKNALEIAKIHLPLCTEEFCKRLKLHPNLFMKSWFTSSSSRFLIDNLCRVLHEKDGFSVHLGTTTTNHFRIYNYPSSHQVELDSESVGNAISTRGKCKYLHDIRDYKAVGSLFINIDLDVKGNLKFNFGQESGYVAAQEGQEGFLNMFLWTSRAPITDQGAATLLNTFFYCISQGLACDEIGDVLDQKLVSFRGEFVRQMEVHANLISDVFFGNSDQDGWKQEWSNFEHLNRSTSFSEDQKIENRNKIINEWRMLSTRLENLEDFKKHILNMQTTTSDRDKLQACSLYLAAISKIEAADLSENLLRSFNRG